MDFININGGTADPFYRYKMPEIVTQHESSGNGIKTNITNIHAIAKSLIREVEELRKFFNVYMQTNVKIKEHRLLINGSFSKSELESALSKYIETFVVCLRCKLPETSYGINKSKTKLYKRCGACGFKEKVEDFDKLTKFIIKSMVNLSKN